LLISISFTGSGTSRVDKLYVDSVNLVLMLMQSIEAQDLPVMLNTMGPPSPFSMSKFLRLLSAATEGEECRATIQQHNSHLTSSVGLAMVADYEQKAVDHLLSFSDLSAAGGAARVMAVNFLRTMPTPLQPLLASFKRIDERSLQMALAGVLRPDISSDPTSLLGSISAAFITYGNLHAQGVTGLPTFSVFLAALLHAMSVAGRVRPPAYFSL
jgi:hypothetical protein